MSGGDESPVLPHGAYRHRTGNPKRDDTLQPLKSDNEESDEKSEKTQDSDSGSESDPVQNRNVIN